jgi:hypothetical protein
MRAGSLRVGSRGVSRVDVAPRTIFCSTTTSVVAPDER